MSKFTCINCRVAFSDADIQRQHYKTDWHRYNLKRKVVDLPPVSAEEFQRRVILQREQEESVGKDNSVYCKVCHKTFNSTKSFDNHLKSKKHLSLASESVSENYQNGDVGSSRNSQSEISMAKKTNEVFKGSSDSECESDLEEVDSDEWDEEYSDNNPILENNCLFCSHHSASMTKNLKHMTVAHSFFIPDVEYIIDVKGLLLYLGEKIVQGFMCLWCNDKGRAFYSSEAAQQHMIDKGHCKMLHEGEALLEYSDYYDYSTSYPDHGLEFKESEDDEVDIPVIDSDDYQLVLPSGAVIGHRSLMKYYRQNIDPSRVVVPVQRKVHRVIAQYRALGWTGDKQSVVRKARDLKFMTRVQAKYNMKLGMKANNLCIKRPQVNF